MKDNCKRAIKILTQYERLAEKLGIKLNSKRLKELDRKRDVGKVTIDDLPGKLRIDWPKEFENKTLAEIRQLCG